MTEYKPADYLFPELYIKGKVSGRYMNVDLDAKRYVISSKPLHPLALGLEAYEEGFRLFNLDEGKVRETYAILLPWRKEAILVEEGSEFLIVEAHGVQVNFIAREGDLVNEGGILAYVLTGKGETRTLRSPVRGVVIYILWFRDEPGQRYAYLIANEDSVVVLKPSG
ncbi:MAG: DUF2118 domain-containing protein [Desulfurococcales archaeon]|nr:DUF2118 domain-containing protein [Desulfurococcales archaeon]